MEAAEEDRTRWSVRWATVHVCQRIVSFIQNHRLASAITSLAIVLITLLFREEWQPYIVVLRRYTGPIVLSLGVLAAAYLYGRTRRWIVRLAVYAIAIVLVSGGIFTYEYVALYMRYESFKVEMIDRMPETDNERIQPQASVYGLAQSVMGDSRDPQAPDFVWVKDRKTGAIQYRWTMGVEPRYWLDKVFGSIDEVISVSGTDASLHLSPEARVKVHFTVGENLWLSSNARTAAIRSFNPMKFFGYEPADVRFLEDDQGVMVEVVSLLRWRGILFPYPEFGGVLVIRQRPSSVWGMIRRVLFGAGEWIPPEDVQNVSFLRGQNILPYRVSRYVAESLRFMNGILAPFPGYHQGDVRVPVSETNANAQPYTTFFKGFSGIPGMLHHYFSLEPYLEGKNGLVASVLIPADGTSRVFVYYHERRDESLIGVSQVPGLVRDSRKTYNWDKVAPVEERPYVRYIDGKRNFFWLTTVITYKDVQKREFAAGSIPDVILINAVTREVFWVDPRKQDEWKTVVQR